MKRLIHRLYRRPILGLPLRAAHDPIGFGQWVFLVQWSVLTCDLSNLALLIQAATSAPGRSDTEA